MEVFSPLVDVQLITPSIGSFWDNREDLKKGARKPFGGWVCNAFFFIKYRTECQEILYFVTV
jgi:hypothetical protein